MNRIIEDFRKDDERILDQLVDGELTNEDRKALLAALDDEPGSWRRCALAFLEAQSWRGDFQAAREAAPAPATPPSPPVTLAPPATTKTHKQSHFFELCLAMAACLVMAFGIGAWVRSSWSPPGGPGMDLAKTPRAINPLTPSPQTVKYAKLNFDDPTSQGPDQLKVPLREVENLTEDHLRQSPSALPDGVQQALEHSGHRVIRSRQIVPFRLDDGRQLLMPVEQVDVEPGNRTAY